MSTTPSKPRRKQERFGIKALLNPGWILSAVLVVAFSYFALTVLAPWQLGKDDRIVHRNQQIDAAFSQEPVDVAEIFGDATVDDNEEWFRVTATGHYLGDAEVLLRMRPVEGQPGYQSLVPFETTSGETILINRGFSPTPGTEAPDIPPVPKGEVTIVGHAMQGEPSPHKAPMNDHGFDQVYGINTDEIGELEGVELQDDYIQLAPDQPGVINAIPVPKLDRGSHLSYGFQWIAFGIMAPLGLGYFVIAELRERKKVREERAALAAQQQGAGDHGDGAATAVSPDATPTDPPAISPAAEYATPSTSAPASASAGDGSGAAEESVVKQAPAKRGRSVRDRYGADHRDQVDKFRPARRDDC